MRRVSDQAGAGGPRGRATRWSSCRATDGCAMTTRSDGFGDGEPRRDRRRERDRATGAAGAIVAALVGGRLLVRRYRGHAAAFAASSPAIERAEVRMERARADRVRMQSERRHRERREHEGREDGPGAAAKLRRRANMARRFHIDPCLRAGYGRAGRVAMSTRPLGLIHRRISLLRSCPRAHAPVVFYSCQALSQSRSSFACQRLTATRRTR